MAHGERAAHLVNRTKDPWSRRSRFYSAAHERRAIRAAAIGEAAEVFTDADVHRVHVTELYTSAEDFYEE